MLENVVSPGFKGDFEAELIEWEKQLELYEASSGRRVEDDLKLAIILKVSPVDIRTYLLANAGQHATYKDLSAVIRNYLPARRVWGPSSPSDGPLPM